MRRLLNANEDKVSRINTAFTDGHMNPKPMIGVLTDSEVLLVDTVQGKRVLRSLLLTADARTPSGLLEYLWQTELASVWLMPATALACPITSAPFETPCRVVCKEEALQRGAFEMILQA